MGWELTLLMYVVIFLSLLAGGLWIGTALGVTGVIGISLLSGTTLWRSFGDVFWNMSNSFTLTAVPLFVFMGAIILRSGISGKFYKSVSNWLRPIPGGLLHSNIVACAIFAAISGSSTATAMAIGTVAIPEMRSRGYDDATLLGSLVAGGCLGILIPPSIPMVIYGSVVQESVADLFMAGFLPGILLALLFMAYILILVLFRPQFAPREERGTSLKELIFGLGDCWSIVLLIFLIMGGIYFGVVTPTEAAGIGCGASIILGFIYRNLNWKSLWQSLSDAVAANCVMMFIILGAQIFTFAIVNTGIPQELSNFLIASKMPKWVFMVLLVIMYGLMGCFIDGISMMLLTIPTLFPTIKAYGIDGVWFGIFLVIMIEWGQITPPVGLNLFAVQAISGGRSISFIVKAALPFCVPILITFVLIYLFPEIVLYLPSTMIRR
jgi:C4-dicarboxylate transporter, DctM subunit